MQQREWPAFGAGVDHRRRRGRAALVAALGISIGCGNDPLGQTAFGQLEGPGRVDFGEVQVGARAVRTLRLKNIGQSLRVQEIGAATSLRGDDPEYVFEVCAVTTSGCEPVIDQFVGANEELELELSFQAIDVMDAPVAARIELWTDQTDEERQPVRHAIELTGQGVRSGLRITPNPVDFGRVLLGTDRVVEVRFTNDLPEEVKMYATPASGGGAALVGPDAALFEVVAPLPDARTGALWDGRVFAPGESAVARLRFAPDPDLGAGPAEAEWRVRNCEAAECEVAVSLVGEGSSSALECTPARLDFGQVNEGVEQRRSVVCTNVTHRPVVVTNWALSEDSDAAFGVAPYEDAGVDWLPEGGQFEIELRFAPSPGQLGASAAGQLTVWAENPDAPGQALAPLHVALSGTVGGENISVLPAVLAFGQVGLTAPRTRSLVIQNLGVEALEVHGIEVDPPFQLDGRQMVLPPGAQEVVEVRFAPAGLGVATGTLRVRSSDSDQPLIEVPVSGEGVDMPPCHYAVSPDELHFGVVQVLRIVSRAVRIENVGNTECVLQDVALSPDSSDAFRLSEGRQSELRILPGEEAIVPVSFLPSEDGVAVGALEFYAPDPAAPNGRVGLQGQGATSTLLISPSGIDFGQLGLQCSSRAQTVTVYNTGSAPTKIQAVEFPPGVSSEFSMQRRPDGLPDLVLAAGGSFSFDVRYQARDSGTDLGRIHIQEEGLAWPYVLPLFGAGAESPENEDVFTQLETPEVDILFVVDNSCSMGEEQASLSANFQSFIDFAEAEQLDYHISVVSTDASADCTSLGGERPSDLDQGKCGYFANGDGDNRRTDPSWRIITPASTPNPSDAFATVVDQGVNGSGEERGLQAAYLALTAPRLVGWNDGFLRPDAYLALVFLSDEEDHSSPTVDFYVNFFRGIKGFRSSHLFSASAIVGDYPDGCGSAVSGARYVQVAERTGGIFESICTPDWSQSLENLGRAVFGYRSTFFLQNDPVVDSIRVYIDGVEMTEEGPGAQRRWRYDAAERAVKFESLAIPEPGSEIRVTYQAECL